MASQTFVSAQLAVPAVTGQNSGGGFGVSGVSNTGVGVNGTCSGGNSGVAGVSDTGHGVHGESRTNHAVHGESLAGRGVVGISQTFVGVTGQSTSNDGVFGTSQSGIGVHGTCAAGNSGVSGVSDTGHGVHGESRTNHAVHGESAAGRGVVGISQTFVGVTGESTSNDGVFGTSQSGIGVHGKGGHLAGFFEGDVEVTGDLRLLNADCAEDFDVSGTVSVQPGTVMVLNDEGALSESEQAYDTRVAGVISGAGSYKPAIILDKRVTSCNRQPIALIGKVYCQVDAQFGAIKAGDLLTTSPTPGHAMKISDPFKGFGAVIGKALRPLANGQGLIPILIALQ
jgi:hypothetical protein